MLTHRVYAVIAIDLLERVDERRKRVVAMEKADRYLPRLASRIGRLVVQIIDLPDRKHTFVAILEGEVCAVVLAVC
jgi:hypothetical protein